MDARRGAGPEPPGERRAPPAHRGAGLTTGPLAQLWTPQHGPLIERPDSGGRWIFPGRRVLAAGSWRDGLREVWAHPWRIAHAATLRVGGAAVETAECTRTPELGERTFRTDLGPAQERWTASAAHAAVLWDAAAGSDADVAVEWSADLRTAGAPAGGALTLERGEGFVTLRRQDGPVAEYRLALGDSLEPRDDAGDGVRLQARGRGAVRIVFLAGADDADLERARERLVKRGIAGLVAERSQHARLVAEYGTAIESPLESEARAFEWAKVEADSLLVAFPDGGRRLAARYRDPAEPDWSRLGPVEWGDRAATLSLGSALLAAGLREPVREALRSSAGDAAALAAPWRQWTGEAIESPEHALRAQPAPSAAAWKPLLDGVIGCWGARPASGSALALAPDLGDRREMALRRLRVGQSVVDVELRRRFDRVVARLHRRHGPMLPVTLELRDRTPAALTADDEPVPGGRVTLPVTDRHEVVFQF